jgi:hypothetical protein
MHRRKEEMNVRVGTKSVIFGAHCLALHWLFLAAAWWKLYGFPWDPRLWVAFMVHDVGYIGRSDMDGRDGERHVELGARIMGCFFGSFWRDLCLCHSRYYAKRLRRRFSRLCVADKLAFVITPAWLYIPMTRATGELEEYMQRSADRQAGGEKFTAEESAMISSADPRVWLEGLQGYTQRWVDRHRDGGEDNWTVGEQRDMVALSDHHNSGLSPVRRIGEA